MAKRKGLWANIHAKRKRGERPAKPGEKGYPKTLDIMKTPPKWIPDLPLDAEGKIVERYEK